jgi:glycosyltransferase involved in cell wall biosynthesis
VFLDSVGICLRAGLDVRAAIVGDGVFRPRMEARSRALGLQNQVRFTGQLSTVAEVRQQLDEADLFVLPSKTEGLPRAMLEAMARALPCIGTAVGIGVAARRRSGYTGDARQLEKILDTAVDPRFPGCRNAASKRSRRTDTHQPAPQHTAKLAAEYRRMGGNCG